MSGGLNFQLKGGHYLSHELRKKKKNSQMPLVNMDGLILFLFKILREESI